MQCEDSIRLSCNAFFFQELSSPNFPSTYPSSVRCRWTLSAPNGFEKIFVKFTNFSVAQSPGCNGDYLRLLDLVRGEDLLHVRFRLTFLIYFGQRNKIIILFYSMVFNRIMSQFSLMEYQIEYCDTAGGGYVLMQTFL